MQKAGHFPRKTSTHMTPTDIKTTLEAQITQLRAALILLSKAELYEYLKFSSTETTSTSLIFRNLVIQAINVKCAESRRSGK